MDIRNLVMFLIFLLCKNLHVHSSHLPQPTLKLTAPGHPTEKIAPWGNMLYTRAQLESQASLALGYVQPVECVGEGISGPQPTVTATAHIHVL